MSNFGMVGKLHAEPENREQLVDILSQASDLMQSAEGCNLYVVSKDADDDTAVWVMELWDSKEAHDNSLKREDVRALIGQAMPILIGSPDGATLIPVRGAGI